MSILLHVDSSPMYGTSVSRELSAAFVRTWKDSNPSGDVVERDLTALAIPPIDGQWIGAAYTPEEVRTPVQSAALQLSNSLIAELQQADEYVIGVPMHNFGIPAALKLWIDQIVRVGATFVYENGQPKGLVVGKKATFIVATGGIYDPGTQMASFNFVEPYLQAVFSFLGLAEVKFVTAGGAMALNYGQDRATFLAPHLQILQAHATNSAR